MWLAQPFIENFVRKIKKRDDFTGHNFQLTKPVPSRPANKPDGTGRPAILSRPVLNPGPYTDYLVENNSENVPEGLNFGAVWKYLNALYAKISFSVSKQYVKRSIATELSPPSF